MLPLGCAYDTNTMKNSFKNNNLFLRSCTCAQAQAKQAFEEYKQKLSSQQELSSPLKPSDYKGKRLYYSSSSSTEQKQQVTADDFTTRYLLDILYNKNNKDNNTNNTSSTRLLYTVIRDDVNTNEDVEVSVDLNNLVMTGLKSGKVYKLCVM